MPRDADAGVFAIHQTWKDAEVPARWQAFRESWRRWPGAALQLWTDADNRDLVASFYPELLASYDAYPRPIARADLARYCLLDHFGGLYADLDCECLRPFPELLTPGELVLGLEPAAHLGPPQRSRGFGRVLSNALIAGPPGHPFWQHVFEAILAAAGQADPLDATGPFLLTRVFEAVRPPAVTVLPESYFSPFSKYECWAAAPAAPAAVPAEAVAIHHWDGSWWRPPGELARTFASSPCLSTRSGSSRPREQGALP